MMFYGELHADPELLAKHLTPESRTGLLDLQQALESLTEWSSDAIQAAIQAALKRNKLKMPALAMPVRVMVFGLAQTPSLAHVLALAGREHVLKRLAHYLES
jgi:glutamyl-tRNA synthetase